MRIWSVAAALLHALGCTEVHFGNGTSVMSGGDGAFRIEIPPGTYQVTAAGADVLSAAHLRAYVSDRMSDRLVVPVVRTATVEGRLISSDGGPVSDATISFETTRDDDKVQGLSLAAGLGQAYPDSDGRFELKVIPGQVTVVGRSALGRAASPPLAMEGGKTYQVELMVAAPVELSGMVTSARGRPAAGATVHLHPYGVYVSGQDFRVATTDESGRYVIRDGFPGELAMEAYAEGQGHAPPVRVELKAGGSHKQDFRLREPQSVAGRVLLRGSGISTRVRAHRPMGRIDFETTSDEAGRFQFNDLAPGPYWLEAYRPDGSSLNTPRFESPASGVVIELDKKKAQEPG